MSDTKIDLGLLLDALPGLVWTALPDGRAEYVGRQWLDYTGLSFEEATGVGWIAAVHPEDTPRLLSEWARIIESRELGEVEARLRRHDGAYRWFLFRASPMYEPTGDVLRWSGMNIDIDDRVRAEEELRYHRGRLERIFEGLPVISGLFSSEGKIVFCNRQMLDFLGMTLEEVQARPSAFDYHPDDRAEAMAAWWAAVRGGHSFQHVGRLRRRDGAYLWHRLLVAPLRNAAGETELLYGVASNIDVQVRAEAALAGEKQLLQMVATGRPLTEVLDALCREVEALTPESRCGILLVGPDRQHFRFGAGPSIPEAYRLACDGVPIDPTSGPCALAVVSKKAVISPDIMEDARWASSPLLPVVAVSGLAACWSMPILISNGEAAGDLTVYRAEPSSADATDLGLIDRFVHIAGIAIERTQADAALKASEGVLACEKQLLEQVAKGEALPVVLGELARAVEALVPDCFCTILIVGEDGATFQLGAAPTLPDTYKALLDGKDIDPNYGPLSRCIFDKAPIVVGDVTSDPRWARSAWPARMVAHGLHSSWTAPILAADGTSLAAFAMYRRAPQIPTPRELELIDRFAHIAGIAIERAQADAALKASEAQVRRTLQYMTLAQQLSGTGSWAQNMVTDEQDLSDEMYRLWEFDPNAAVTQRMVHERIHPDDLATFVKVRGAALATGEDFKIAYRVVMPGGTVKHLRTYGQRQTDSSDRLVYVGATQDVTDWKLAEEGLRASQAELLQAYAHLNEAQRLSRTGSFTWDVERDEHNWSAEERRMWEFDPDVKITMPMILEAVHPDDMPLANQVIGGALQQTSFELVLRILTKSGALKYVHIVGRRVEDIADRPVFLGAIQDITERRFAEDALNKARAELAHVSRAMTVSALTASIAHEVNQPLAGIITNASTGLRMLAADTPNLDSVRGTIQRTLRDGNRASDIIRRLRAMFARREPGMETVDLNDAAREVLTMSEGELRQRRVTLTTDFAEDLPTPRGDRVQLQQVILNLVLNAVDAMDGIEGRPRNLQVSTRRGAHGEIQLSVQDSGVGLSADAIEQAFNAFYTTKPDGMGIGLAISRTIIENHEGRLWATSNGDSPGATFLFSLRPSACPEGGTRPMQRSAAE